MSSHGCESNDDPNTGAELSSPNCAQSAATLSCSSSSEGDCRDNDRDSADEPEVSVAMASFTETRERHEGTAIETSNHDSSAKTAKCAAPCTAASHFKDDCSSTQHVENGRQILSSLETVDSSADTVTSTSCQDSLASDSGNRDSFPLVSRLRDDGLYDLSIDDDDDDECHSIYDENDGDDDEEWRLQLLKDYYNEEDDCFIGTQGTVVEEAMISSLDQDKEYLCCPRESYARYCSSSINSIFVQ